MDSIADLSAEKIELFRHQCFAVLEDPHHASQGAQESRSHPSGIQWCPESCTIEWIDEVTSSAKLISFDDIFWNEYKLERIFDEALRPVIHEALEGKSSTFVFVGDSDLVCHLTQGNGSSAGLIQNSIDQIMQQCHTKKVVDARITCCSVVGDHLFDIARAAKSNTPISTNSFEWDNFNGGIVPTMSSVPLTDELSIALLIKSMVNRMETPKRDAEHFILDIQLEGCKPNGMTTVQFIILAPMLNKFHNGYSWYELYLTMLDSIDNEIFKPDEVPCLILKILWQSLFRSNYSSLLCCASMKEIERENTLNTLFSGYQTSCVLRRKLAILENEYSPSFFTTEQIDLPPYDTPDIMPKNRKEYSFEMNGMQSSPLRCTTKSIHHEKITQGNSNSSLNIASRQSTNLDLSTGVYPDVKQQEMKALISRLRNLEDRSDEMIHTCTSPNNVEENDTQDTSLVCTFEDSNHKKQLLSANNLYSWKTPAGQSISSQGMYPLEKEEEITNLRINLYKVEQLLMVKDEQLYKWRKHNKIRNRELQSTKQQLGEAAQALRTAKDVERLNLDELQKIKKRSHNLNIQLNNMIKKNKEQEAFHKQQDIRQELQVTQLRKELEEYQSRLLLLEEQHNRMLREESGYKNKLCIERKRFQYLQAELYTLQRRVVGAPNNNLSDRVLLENEIDRYKRKWVHAQALSRALAKKVEEFGRISINRNDYSDGGTPPCTSHSYEDNRSYASMDDRIFGSRLNFHESISQATKNK